MHLASIPFSLLVLRSIMEHAVGRSLPWDQFFTLAADRQLLEMIVLGAVLQVAFAEVAAFSAIRLARGRFQVAPLAAVAGVAGVIVSLLVFGGLFGAAGGVLSIAGAVQAIRRARVEAEPVHGALGPTGPPGAEPGPLPFPRRAADSVSLEAPPTSVLVQAEPGEGVSRRPAITGLAAAMAYEQAHPETGVGHLLAAGAAIVHLLSIPLVLVVMKATIETARGWDMSWGELFGDLQEPTVLRLFMMGVTAQIVFCVIAAIGALTLRNGGSDAAMPLIVLGVVAVLFSFIVFGGVVGAIGGFLSILGGAKALEGRYARPV